MFPSFEEAKAENYIPHDEISEIIRINKKKIMITIIISLLLTCTWIVFIGIEITNSESVYSISANGEEDINAIMFIVPIIILGFTAWYINKKQRKFNAIYKEKVILPLAQSIISLMKITNHGENHKQQVDLEPTEHISLEWVDKSNLFNKSYNKHTGNDYFYGQLGLTEFHFSELQLLYESGSGKNKRTTPVFLGLFYVADFKKHFEGTTIIVPDTIKEATGVSALFNKVLNKVTSTTKIDQSYQIELENEQFNQTFQIITTNEIEARYILSANFIEKILQFTQRNKKRISFSFSESYMYIGISTLKNFFDYVLLHHLFSKNQDFGIREAYDDLVFLFSIIEEFELNNRIWSKV